MSNLNRRDFIKTTGTVIGAAGLGVGASPAAAKTLAAKPKTLRVLQVGVGGIGGMDRGAINRCSNAEIVGLVDVDTNTLARVGKQFPKAFTDTDYRKVFADRKNDFDAVNVCTPDLHHAPIMIGALALDKHVYGQKPLVQQLEEITLLENAIKAKPHLATNTGNQRMQSSGRRIAVDVLKRNLLGKAVEAWCWTSSKRGSAKALDLPPAKQPPAHIDWDLWLGPAEKQPYRDGIAPNRWRAWWDFGTAALGDWGVHLLDIIMYSYPELDSPVTVKCETPRAADWYHTANCKATMTYAVKTDRFKNNTFPIHYLDAGQKPDLTALGVPIKKVRSNATLVICEEGALFIYAGGQYTLFHKGKEVTAKDIGANTDVGEYKHWGNWVDQALGDKTKKVWTPFDAGLRMTECAILPVKASRFPGKELKWDKKKLEFTNHQQATDTVVRRKYRDGFAPPKIASKA